MKGGRRARGEAGSAWQEMDGGWGGMKGSPCQIRCEGLSSVHLAYSGRSRHVAGSRPPRGDTQAPASLPLSSVRLSASPSGKSARRKLTSSLRILPPSITPRRSRGSCVEGDSQAVSMSGGLNVGVLPLTKSSVKHYET